jgi:hypothetical protein
LPFPGLDDYMAVYFAQSYNFAGNVVAVPRSCVTPLAMKSSDLMSFVVSGGIAGLARHSEPGRAPGVLDTSPGDHGPQ